MRPRTSTSQALSVSTHTVASSWRDVAQEGSQDELGHRPGPIPGLARLYDVCPWIALDTDAPRSPAAPTSVRGGRGSGHSAWPPARRATTSSELRELLLTAGVATVGELVQHRERPHPNTYLGPGKIDELKARSRRADANVVACDDELSPRQERNLEEALGVPVIDRTAVILDIFADHAHSAEGKLQVELAQLEYNLARMRGLWTHLERLGAGRIDGGIGTRGPGETPDRDRPPPGPRPHHRAARKLDARERLARRHARRARARRPAPDRARRLHERRQVDAAQRPRRLRRRGARPPLPHAGPDDAHGSLGGRAFL